MIVVIIEMRLRALVDFIRKRAWLAYWLRGVNSYFEVFGKNCVK